MVQVVCRSLTGRHAVQTRSVYQEDVLPSVVVVINKGRSAASGLEEVSILVLVSINGPGGYAGLPGDVGEGHPKAICSRPARRRFASTREERKYGKERNES